MNINLKPMPTIESDARSWQKSLADVITNPKELCELLQLDPQKIFVNTQQDFALRVPRGFVARMKIGDIHDPLLKQVLPIAAELQISPGYTHHPLQENKANPLPGLLHKYTGRVLLLVAGGCAIHCRYCFRRHFAYTENAPNKAHYAAILDYIRADTSIHEVIYSGGDPLILKDDTLSGLTQKIATIPHVTTLRIHTRLPIVIPERVSDGLLQVLTQTRLRPVMVLHCNHANEIDNHVIAAINRLRQAQITVLNQTVLLRGVNDSAQALINLSEHLFKAGALPYYLHILDTVQGAAHFEVSLAKARRLVGEISCTLPGYLVPKLVQEKPGMRAKFPLLARLPKPRICQ